MLLLHELTCIDTGDTRYSGAVMPENIVGLQPGVNIPYHKL